jgi:hypothetical protein
MTSRNVDLAADGGKGEGPAQALNPPKGLQGDLVRLRNRAELRAEDMAFQPLPVSALRQAAARCGGR